MGPCNTIAEPSDESAKKQVFIDLTGKDRGVPLPHVPCGTVNGDFPCDTFTGALGSSAAQSSTKNFDIVKEQGFTPAESISDASSIVMDLTRDASDASLIVDLTSKRST